MDGIKQIIITYCFCAAACGVMYFLVPKGNMEKPFRVFVSVFFLAVLLTPILKFSIDFSAFDNIIENETGVTVPADILSVYSDKIKTDAGTLLRENNILYKNIDVAMDIDGDNYIYIKRISLELENEADRNAAEKLIENETGVIPEVVSGQ
ncbi:MAG: stage III sporulation protein AF [Oscillospiraceae bacterium]|nr:stage III sporulation protein AF [Oscillospiraceae bacterium]